MSFAGGKIMPIQIDIEMPKSCFDCPLFNREHFSCNIIGYDEDVSFLSRSKNCPLEEVK